MQMLCSIPGVDPARRQRLIDVLDIDPTWRMHQVSDGQRRRVQIAMGLLRPFQVLLLDEITVDLDVLGRSELMAFLKAECAERGASIVYVRAESFVFSFLREEGRFRVDILWLPRALRLSLQQRLFLLLLLLSPLLLSFFPSSSSRAGHPHFRRPGILAIPRDVCGRRARAGIQARRGGARAAPGAAAAVGGEVAACRAGRTEGGSTGSGGGGSP